MSHADDCSICQGRAKVAASKQKRTSVYVMQPSHFEIPGCACGNNEPEWSEYKEHLWCAKCKKDFVPEHWGVLDGPVGVQTSLLIGLNFDRFNLKTNRIERTFAKERAKLGMPPTKYRKLTGAERGAKGEGK